MTAVIDYDAGNIRSVEKALLALGEEVLVTRDKEAILSAERIILPGVGAFGDAMGRLHNYGLVDVIRQAAVENIPFLGICLGLQLLFERSEESGRVQGLGILKGEILRIPDHADVKVPHIGWNSIALTNSGRLFKGVPEHSYVYFVHSYFLRAAEEEIVTASTVYGTQIHASVEKGNIFACQFHPEKSSRVGLKILKNFISIQRKD
ncbi:MAG: imidazole glycerol phosphate synthase subunit HisH [Lachnospiraceae bacterium]|nr:imidazole glycerol phosphate synthase subunit HisH [Lachnospiraceae bacterium]